MEYILSYTKNPSFAILANDNYFIHLENRIGRITTQSKSAAIKHIDYLIQFKEALELPGYLQPRKLFYDDKHATYNFLVHYLYEKNTTVPKFSFEHDVMIIDGQHTTFELEVIPSIFVSDHFDINHNDYYKDLH